MRMTMEETLKFDIPVWNKISNDCKDLVGNLLKKSPSQRIKLDEAVKHPWFDSVRRKYSTEI